ncbi:ABC transporter ATP-binding protein [Ahrensia sp. 13_GOM-1096m]|uniref:iron ABC transporter ATP-binding protein n=1 Tax=Ahrensia sp. 13_GOM-1096m TaxID=1380380 RepID=UPI00047E356C|nr:ATP-binding cassette domain-containing protein [Ahrensia sp. 13_GOM-1096m]
MIKLTNVAVSLSGTPILSDINLELPSGGITALIGPNGAGKSTLISAMARLVPVTSGEIIVDGMNVANTASRTLAQRLSIMPQDNAVAGRLRVGELVQFGRFPHHQGRPTQADFEAVDEALNIFDLFEIKDKFVDTLSGGQRQRARAAMCFAQGTDYILLDEPLNNLDIFYARELMRTLRHVADTKQRSIIIVLHDLNHAAVHADRIIAMRDGKIIADDRPDKVMHPNVLQSVFGFQINVETIAGKPISLHFL